MSSLLPILNPEAIVEEPALTPEARRAEEEKNKMRRYTSPPTAASSPAASHPSA